MAKQTSQQAPMLGRPGGPAGSLMGGPAQKPRNFGKTMKQLIRYMKEHRSSVILVAIMAIASTAFTIVSPRLLGDVTNHIVAGIFDKSSNGIDYAAILKIIYILIGLYLTSAFLTYVQSWIMSGISQKITYRLRRDIAAKMNRLPLRYFDSRTHGEVLSRVTNDVDTINQTLNQSLIQLLTSATTLIGILIMMLTISWQMTLVAIFILPLSFALIKVVVGKSQGFFVSQQKGLGAINGHVEEMFAGHPVMKAFGGEARSVEKFEGINNELYHNSWKAQFYSGLLMPIMMFVGNLGYVGVAVLGGWLALNGKLRIGDIQAFIQYMSQFTQPIMQTASIANVLQSTAAAAERVFEFLNEEEESAEVTKPGAQAVKGEVVFDNVSFGYVPGKPVIKGFSARVAPGQKVAIVGPTGAGKTTIVNLLMRFYDVDGGAIRIDGVDIRDMKRSDVRKMFGMVLQDTWLFSGSLGENIAYGKDHAGHEAVVKAAEAAHADHFIRSLPGGYEMELNEEADNISQGEKQLLTIARAMMAAAPMLVLDEATSSVDTRTEVLIQQAMDVLMAGRTSFIIAHRLSTIRNADLILVMKDGSVLEQGKHEDLLKANGFYASLYNAQFSGN